MGISACCLLSWAIINAFGRPMLRYLLYCAIAVNSVGVFSFIVAILVKAKTYQPASFVFQDFSDMTGPDGGPGWSTRASPAYVACIGALIGISNFVGYDASAHLSEETRRAAWVAPLGIVTSVGLSALTGFALIIALLFSIQDFEGVITSMCDQPVLQILIDLFGVDGALAAFTLPIVCTWFCGLFMTTSVSRMVWAFSRDGGIVSFVHFEELIPLTKPASLFQQGQRGFFDSNKGCLPTIRFFIANTPPLPRQ